MRARALDNDAGCDRDAMLHEAQGLTMPPLQGVCAMRHVCKTKGTRQDEKQQKKLAHQAESLLSQRRAQRGLQSRESASFRDGRGSNCIGGLRSGVGSGKSGNSSSLQEGKWEGGSGRLTTRSEARKARKVRSSRRQHNTQHHPTPPNTHTHTHARTPTRHHNTTGSACSPAVDVSRRRLASAVLHMS